MTGSTSSTDSPARLRTFADIRDYLRTSPQPVFYLSRTPTNLLGVERWVAGLSFVSLVDPWDGRHPSVFTPSDIPRFEPRGNVNVINWLLRNSQVQRHIASRSPAGMAAQIVAAFFDEETEKLCRELGYTLVMPSAALRTRLDSKIATTKIGETGGVLSVPNILTRVSSWADLTQQAADANLGSELVIQTPYGDSGNTTYFVSTETDFRRVARHVTRGEVKVMKKITPLALATEAVITKQGVVIGPCLREITGYEELTRYRGGWSGSEMSPSIVRAETRRRLFELTENFSEQLSREGYRGILGIDVLVDTETDEVYLGELNPRITGSAALSNLVPQRDQALPLFAFHVLEYADVDFALDTAQVNALLEAGRNSGDWSTMIIQHTARQTEIVTGAPPTGRYRIEDDGELTFVADDLDWHTLSDADEVFYLRVLGAGEHRSYGADLGVLVTRTRLQEEHNALTPDALGLIRAVQRLYEARPISQVTRVTRAVARRALALIDKLRR